MRCRIKQRTYEHIEFPPLTDEQRKELEELRKMKDNEIDMSDIPEVDASGQFYYYQTLKSPTIF